MALIELRTRTLELTGRFGDEEIIRSYHRNEIIEVIDRFGNAGDALDAMVQTGASAILAASTNFDVTAMQQEMQWASARATEAMDMLGRHITGIVADEGPLAIGFQKAGEELASELQSILATHADPSVQGSIVARISAAMDRANQAMAASRQEMTLEIQRTVTAMREIDETSPLGKLLVKIERSMTDLTACVAASQARAAERKTSTAKGGDYEELVMATVSEIAHNHGDRAEHTGTQQGKLLRDRKFALAGDVTCEVVAAYVPDQPRIVLEAMARGAKELSLPKVHAELDAAMRNREAQAAIAVISSDDNSILEHQPFAMLGPNRWAVWMDAERPDPLALRVVYRLARESMIAAALRTSSLDLETLKAECRSIAQEIHSLESVRTQIENIGTSQKQALQGLIEFETRVRSSCNRMVEAIVAHYRAGLPL